MFITVSDADSFHEKGGQERSLVSKSGLGEIGELGDEGTCVVLFPEEQTS